MNENNPEEDNRTLGQKLRDWSFEHTEFNPFFIPGGFVLPTVFRQIYNGHEDQIRKYERKFGRDPYKHNKEGKPRIATYTKLASCILAPPSLALLSAKILEANNIGDSLTNFGLIMGIPNALSLVYEIGKSSINYIRSHI